MAERSKNRSKKGACVFGCLGIPTLALLGSWLVYVANNRATTIVVPPTLPRPIDNAFDDFASAGSVAMKLTNKSPMSIPNPPEDNASALLLAQACATEFAPTLAKVRAALNKPCLAPQSRSSGTLFPEFALVRELERTMMATQIYHALSGRYYQAAEISLDGAEVGAMMPTGGALIASLVGNACEAIAFSRLEPLLVHLSETELEKVGARLEKIVAKRPKWRDIMQEEGYTAISSLLSSWQHPSKIGFREQMDTAKVFMHIEDDHEPTYSEKYEMFQFAMSNKDAMFKDLQRYYVGAVKEAEGPYLVKSAVPKPPHLFGKVAAISNEFRRSFACTEAVYAILRVEVALYRHRLAKVKYPRQLADLAPYLKHIPDDPCGGAAGVPLVYRQLLNGKNFLLYSRGSDTKDSGGMPGASPSAQGNVDIVAVRIWPKTKWTP